MYGRYAIWPDSVFVSYDKMRMRIHDAISNGELMMTHEQADCLSDDDLVHTASEYWTFTYRKSHNKYDDNLDHDYSMNY